MMVLLGACVWLLWQGAPAAAPIPVGSGPEPSPAPVSWDIDFQFRDPQRIQVQLPGQAQPEVYWYLLYTATNRNDRSVRFFPIFQLVTEDLTVVDTDTGIHPLVFDAIKERHRRTYPDLVHPTKAIGDLLTGDDNARESVAIWRGVDLNSTNFAIYVAGLSGETRAVPNPGFDPQAGPDNPRHFTLRKTLEIRYQLPGSPAARAVVEPQRVDSRWVMR